MKSIVLSMGESYHKQLSTGHVALCPWLNNGCPISFARLPSSHEVSCLYAVCLPYYIIA
jgi:hypothetical protein